MTKTFVITGGGSSNKGAQAMVFAVVQELKKYHPNCEIWMFSNYNEDEGIFKFNVLTWDTKVIFRLSLGSLKQLIKPGRKTNNNEGKIKEILKRTDAIFDVSGFTLTSNFGFLSSFRYLLRIVLAKKYKCKMFLLPQSFGPFDYKTSHKIVLFPLMKYFLRYPEKIFPREKQGYNDIKRFTNNNLIKSQDVVLQTDRPQSEFIFNNHDNKISFIADGNSVAIIPNTKIIKWNKNNDIFNLYKKIISILIEYDYKVYVLRHSYEDLDFCNDIAELAEDNSKLELLAEDYNCIDLNEIIYQMDFVVASRYHSLIHAYKVGVPAMVIGWAQKYPEVMAEFNQQLYYFDIRKKIDGKDVESLLTGLIKNLEDESAKIKKVMGENIYGENSIKKVFIDA